MGNITLKFKGEEYTIAESQAFEAAEQVEDVLTISEIAAMQANPKFVKIAKCFGVLLRFAGCKVSDRDVHSEMMAEVMKMSEDDATEAKEMLAAQAIGSLMAVLLDGAPEDDEAEDPKKA